MHDINYHYFEVQSSQPYIVVAIIMRQYDLIKFIFLQKNIDAGILLTNNQIRAEKSLVFNITRKLFEVSQLPKELRGYSLSLPIVLVWAIRESRLHNSAPSTLLFNLKLDGRPLAGKQVRDMIYIYILIY